MRVVTNDAALRAALLPSLIATSMRKAEAGVQAARSRARVDTGEMRDGINARRLAYGGGARVGSPAKHSKFNEFGTWKMSAQPFMRPSMDAARVAR